MARTFDLRRPSILARLGYPLSLGLVLTFTACDEKTADDTGTGQAESGSSSSGESTSTSSGSEGSGTSASSGGETSNEASSEASTTGTDTGESTGGDQTCTAYPAHACSSAVDCSFGDCGPAKPFTADGCLRNSCESDGDCGTDERCYRASDFGGCASSTISCGDGADGSCECVSTDDCGGAYCIAKDDFPPKGCEGYPEHSCAAAVDCSRYECGPLSPFTSHGCLRPNCENNSDCGDGQSCYRAAEWGGCASSHLSCSDNADLSCDCGGTDDCGGAYCVDENALPNFCGQHTDKESCAAAIESPNGNACAWSERAQVDTKSKSCETTPREGLCIAVVNVGDGCAMNPNCGDDQQVYTMPGSDVVLYNLAGCGAEPVGWTQCLEGSKEAACNCACPD